MVVDAVSAVVEIADADVEPSPSFGAKVRSEFITGMGKLGEKFVILLDIGKVLSVEELAMLGEAGGAQAPVAQPAARRAARCAGRQTVGAREARITNIIEFPHPERPELGGELKHGMREVLRTASARWK